MPRLTLQNQSNSFVGRSTNKRRMSGEHVIENRTESVNIGSACELGSVASSLFWSHVTRRAERFYHCARNGTFSLNKPCQAKIGKMRFAVCIYQDVPRLDIAMENPPLDGHNEQCAPV